MKQGWELKNLSEVCDLQNGFAFKSRNYVYHSNTLNIRMSNIRPDGSFNPEHNIKYLPDSFSDTYSQFLLREGDLVIAMTDMAGDPKILGLPTIVKGLKGRNFLLNQRVGRLKDFSKDIYVPYLCYFLRSSRIKEYYKKKGAGGLQINISKKDILTATIPIPPLAEQQQIVEILDEAFAAIDQAQANIEKNIENAKELFQSKLNDIFSQKGEGWEEKSLNEVCAIKPNKRLAKEKLSENDLVSFVPMKYLGINQKYFGSEQVKPLKKVYSGYVYFEENDVILAKITPCFENGKLGIAKNLKNGVGFGSSEFIVYRPDNSLLPDFLYFFLNREAFRVKGESLMAGAVGHKRIQPEFYEKETISYPTLKEQEFICLKINDIQDSLSKIEENLKQKLTNLDNLKKSILEKAFAGELTATADNIDN